MSDNIKQQKKVLKEAKSYLASISSDIESLFESLKDSPAGDLKYVASKLKDIQDFIKSNNRTKTITESVNVNADMRNKVNNVIVKYQNKNIDEQFIADFFNDCHNVLDLNFHPDTPFEDYINSGGVPCFTKPEAEQLNNIITGMFEWCDARSIDIYELGMENHPMKAFGMGIDLDETMMPTAGNHVESETTILDEDDLKDSEDYKNAYQEFMRWEQNDDELSRQAAHDYALRFAQDAKEDYGELNEIDIEGPGPDVENEQDPEEGDDLMRDIEWTSNGMVGGKPMFRAEYQGHSLEIRPNSRGRIDCSVGINVEKEVSSYKDAYLFFDHEWNPEIDHLRGF